MGERLYAQSYESSNAHLLARANINSISGASVMAFASPAIRTFNRTSISFFANNQYALKELSSIGFFARKQNENSIWSGGVNAFGSNNYQEYRVNIGYALKLENNLYFGIATNAWHIRFRESEANQWFININPALNYTYKKVELGVNLKNIAFAHSSKKHNQEAISIGFAYNFTGVQLLSEIEKYENRPLLLKLAIDYSISDKLSLQYGLSFGNFNQHAGIRYLIKNLWLEFAIFHQSNLGSSTGIAAEYNNGL